MFRFYGCFGTVPASLQEISLWQWHLCSDLGKNKMKLKTLQKEKQLAYSL